MSSMAALTAPSLNTILTSSTYNGNNTTIRNFVNATCLVNDAPGTITATTTQLTLAYDGTHTATFSVSAAGALTVNATSTVTITPATTITGAVTLSSTLAVTGLASLLGSANIAGSVTITATQATFQTTMDILGNFDINTNKFTVAAASGNTVVGGTLNVSGSATLSSTLAVTGAVTCATIAASSTISGTVITASTALAAGGTVASFGDVRIKNNGAGVVARNAANSADMTVLDVGATDVCTVSRNAALTLGNAALTIGFYGAAGAGKPTVAGSRGANAALASLLTSLANLGLLTDSSTI